MANWAAILAGGEGSRLRTITNGLTGDDRPKQFCRLLGKHTLIEETCGRVADNIAPERTTIVSTAHHRKFYGARLRATPPHLLIEQPSSRGTAAAIAFALGRVSRLDPNAVLAVFPSDHYYRHSSILKQAVDLALLSAAVHRDRLVLVGASAERAEADYGWIVPGQVEPTPFSDRPVYGVDGFREKPGTEVAEQLLERGGLWNTFITVGSAAAFSNALLLTLPAHQAFAAEVAQASHDADERRAVEHAYGALAPACFSSEVLSRVPGLCLAVRMTGSGWMDIGRPDRLSIAQTETSEAAASASHLLPAPATTLQLA